MPEAELYTREEAEGVLGLTRPTVTRMIREAKIKLKPMDHPVTGKPCKGLDADDLQTIRDFRADPEKDTRKP